MISGSPFGTGGDVIINSTGCNGKEPDLALCESSPWQTTACINDEVATVDCHVQRKYKFFTKIYTLVKIKKKKSVVFLQEIFAFYS